LEKQKIEYGSNQASNLQGMMLLVKRNGAHIASQVARSKHPTMPHEGDGLSYL